jgi:hypothetical protein
MTTVTERMGKETERLVVQVCMPKEPYKRALLHSKEAY